MKKIMITGAAGFIGSELAHHLESIGCDVICIDNMSFGHEANLTKNGNRLKKFVNLDVRDKSILALMEGVDTVFHFAGIAPLPNNQKSPQDSMDNNVTGTANVLEAARLAGVNKFILSSTSAVYENNQEIILNEDLNVKPNLVYAVSKLAAEQLVMSYYDCYKMPVTILRFFNVYGPHQDIKRQSPPLMGYIVKELLKKQSPVLHHDGTQERDYVHVDDVCKFCCLVMNEQKSNGQVLNVCTGKTVSVNTIFSLCAKELKSDIKPKYREPEKLWDSYADFFEGKYPLSRERVKKETLKFSCGSNKKSIDILGWSPTIPFEEGCKQTIREMINSCSND